MGDTPTPADKLVIRLDAKTPIKRQDGVTGMFDVTVRADGDRAIMRNIFVEPYTQTAMAICAHDKDDFRTNANIARFQKLNWSCPTDHWDNIPINLCSYMRGDGDGTKVQTFSSPGNNTGFHFDTYVYGDEHENFEAFSLFFGQWKLTVQSSGKGQLFRTQSYDNSTHIWTPLSTPTLCAEGWLTSTDRATLCNRKTELTITPCNGKLMIRRNKVAGFTYTLPDKSTEKYGDTPYIIKSAPFGVQASASNAINFEMTMQQFDPTLESSWLSLPVKLPKIPGAGTTITTDIDQEIINGTGASISVQLKQGYDVTLWNGNPAVIDTLADFDPATHDSFCVLCRITPGTYTSPMFRGVKVHFTPPAVSHSNDPDDIVAYVKTCSIDVGDSPTDSSATLTCTVPAFPDDKDTWFGICNRLVEMKIGTKSIFKGVLRNPPTYTIANGGKREYQFDIDSIAKLLNEPCMGHNVRFDMMVHTAVVKWLCNYAGLIDSDLEISSDTTPLPNTVQGQASTKSKLEPGVAETPMEWIDKVCELTGYKFADGISATGDYCIRYFDPLGTITPAHTFHTKTALSAGVGSYDIIYDWKEYSVEPEANQLWVVGCDKNGMQIAAVFDDTASQEPSTPESERPANWLGVTRKAVMAIDGTVPMGLLLRIAYRIGTKISKRIDMAEFRADWKPGLWRGIGVTVDAGGDKRIHNAGTYVIEKINNITFEAEWKDFPLRKATYTASFGAQLLDPLDRALLADISYALRFGMSGQARAVGSVPSTGQPGTKDSSGILSCTGGVARVNTVKPDGTVFDNGTQTGTIDTIDLTK